MLSVYWWLIICDFRRIPLIPLGLINKTVVITTNTKLINLTSLRFIRSSLFQNSFGIVSIFSLFFCPFLKSQFFFESEKKGERRQTKDSYICTLSRRPREITDWYLATDRWIRPITSSHCRTTHTQKEKEHTDPTLSRISNESLSNTLHTERDHATHSTKSII